MECNQQVAIMGEIYSKAQRVLISLGGWDHDLQQISEHFSSTRHIEPKESNRPLKECHKSLVTSLLALPWFSRAWVVQEAILPVVATVLLNSVAFDIDVLWSWISQVRNLEEQKESTYSTNHLRQLPGYLVLSEIIRLRQHQRTRHLDKPTEACFYHSLSIFAPRCRTSKLQDMIFAFLGLIEDHRIIITPDYNMTLNEIPVMATRSIISGTGSLDLFGVLHRNDEEQGLWSQLPSWVPDWSRKLRAEALIFPGSPTYFNASTGFKHKQILDTQSNLNYMPVVGKIIDKVVYQIPFTQGIAAPASNRHGWDVHSFLDMARCHDALQKLWPPNFPVPEKERILTAMLADGSFTFDRKERSRCSNGLTKEHTRKLLEVYESLSLKITERGSKWRGGATSFRDHARIAWGRSLIVGRHWKLGLAHETVCNGDVVCILHGSHVPLILRPVVGGHHRLIGQCYFEGVMRGEAIKWDESDADVFNLI
ncbi:hypothetical protein GQ44DRAFT_830515 [Phaeosphaeriaceae sp. PMI808]|nr:hypothetical protein GQ44DRAFT_830515 [Phaeosphaeriaceae sp. PMI808]